MFKAKKVAGSTKYKRKYINISKVKQCAIVMFFKVNLSTQYI